METADDVIAAIRAAFAGVPRGAITLHEAEVIDDHGSADERSAARALDTEESWDRVPDADVAGCLSALSHLDPEGWRYYVPAYMSWTLRHLRGSPSVVKDFTIYTFAPSDDLTLRAYKRARFGLLDASQSRAVARFLRHLLAHPDHVDAPMAARALAEHWGQFLSWP